MNAPKRIYVDVTPDEFYHTWDTEKSQTRDDDVPYIRADIVEEMRQKLHIAAQVFRAYQAHHEYKEGGANDKSERNKGYAEQMEAALAKLEEE